MTFAITYNCSGCGKRVPLQDVQMVALDKAYCSTACMEAHALAEENVLSQEEVDRLRGDAHA